MRLRKIQERPRPPQAVDALVSEKGTQSEMFDPRVDLPRGELERIKTWAATCSDPEAAARSLIQAAWVGWVDPAYKATIQRKSDLKNGAFSDFLQRREGQRLRLASRPVSPTEGAQMRLTEMAGAYIDFAELVEVFPDLRSNLQIPGFSNDFRQVLDRAVAQNRNRPSTSVVNRIQDLTVLIQVWPERRQQIIISLVRGGLDTQLSLIQGIKEESSIVHAVSSAAQLLLVFPGLKPQVEEVMRERMVEARNKLSEMRRQLNTRELGFFAYNRFIKMLTILGAESASLDVGGNLQIKLRPLQTARRVNQLPAREVV